MAATTTTNYTPAVTPPASSGNIFLDALQTAANWDLLKTYGLPRQLDGTPGYAVAQPVAQYSEQTPPAAPGNASAQPTAQGITSTLAIGGGLVLGAVGLYLLLRR